MKKLLRRKPSPVLYVDHIEARGRLFFEKVCELDLEGFVAKRKTEAYRPTDKPSPYWVKIKNPHYSQLEGREELFERLTQFTKAPNWRLRKQRLHPQQKRPTIQSRPRSGPIIAPRLITFSPSNTVLLLVVIREPTRQIAGSKTLEEPA